MQIHIFENTIERVERSVERCFTYRVLPDILFIFSA